MLLHTPALERIQRVLQVGWLNHQQIAREAGVSTHLVADVALGKRPAVTLVRPVLNVGERFLPKAVRCHGCGAQISVVPCRVCQHRTT